MTKGNQAVDADRIALDLAGLSALTDPGRLWTRRAFSPIFDEGRAWLAARMQAAGLSTRIDAAGNLIGRRAGRDPGRGTILIGSHSDTVPDGGRFDGIAGVLAGLEIARALEDAGITLAHDLEIVDYLAEEVSVFGVSCIGSRGITGALPAEWLVREHDGRSLRRAIADVGGDPDVRGSGRDDIRAALELHIEQGPVLETAGEPVGIVTAIAGITRIAITVTGRPDHAGTTPMTARDDALVTAAGLVLAIREEALRRAAGPEHFTATVGEFAITPGAANVVPGGAEMLVDARAADRAQMRDFLAWLAGQVAAAPGAVMRVISDNPPCPCDPGLCDRLAAAAARLGVPARRMVSGAGHDTAWLSKVAPAAMIFIPCEGGRSHCPEEMAQIEDIGTGAAVLFETLVELDAALADATH